MHCVAGLPIADGTVTAAQFVQSAGTGTTTLNGAVDTNGAGGISLMGAAFTVNATVTIEVRSASGEKDANGVPQTETGTVTMEAAAGPEGLEVTAPPELLAALRQQRHPQGNRKHAARWLTAGRGEA
jgi:hypothetical protein